MREGFVVHNTTPMKSIAKALIAITLFSVPLVFSRCAATRNAGGVVSNDSLVTISRNEYAMLRTQADERYVVVQRRTYDSLLMKTRELQELCDALVEHLPVEVRSEKKDSNN